MATRRVVSSEVVGSQTMCHFPRPSPAAMQIVSRHVIQHLSHTRVIFRWRSPPDFAAAAAVQS